MSQLAARLTARDLGCFFEDKLGENTVMDSRIVTDRLSRRSKGYVILLDVISLSVDHASSIGYVEFRTIDLVEKAIALKGTVVMGLPIMVQLTESERNKLHPGDGQVYILHLVFLCLTLSPQEPQSSSRRQRTPRRRYAVSRVFLRLDLFADEINIQDSTLAPCILISLRAILSRCLNPLETLSSSIFIEIL